MICAHRVFSLGVQVVQLSSGTKEAYSSGRITNMMDTDQSILQTFTTQLNRLWQVPLTFVLALVMIIRQLGWAGAIGVMCMIMLGPSTRIVIAYLRKYPLHSMILQGTDQLCIGLMFNDSLEH